MLQRAASNAFSWWWASHIRTKQSKWLEQSLQDMEEKVENMLKLIEEDGDSFAKRAEMYYKRRPELISSVEDSYRAFKALADRYDMLSKDLQNANHTIGTVFPEQFQLAMEDDEDMPPMQNIPLNLPPVNAGKVPKVPKAPIEKLKSLIKPADKPVKSKPKKAWPPSQSKAGAKSGLSKKEALGEITKVQKEILALQTAKEYVKSSYEAGLAKHWEMENQIEQMQQKVSKLQDEFDVEVVIEDNEARAVMAETALKSCQQTLATFQEKQENAKEEAREEMKKIESARELVKYLKSKYLKDQMDQEDKTLEGGDKSQFLDEDAAKLGQQSREKDNYGNDLDLSSIESLTVSELAENVDKLVNKVVSLETAASTQTALMNRLRTEVGDLQSQITNLENEKATVIGDSQALQSQVKELEQKLKSIEDLNKKVESQNSNLQTDFAQAQSSLGHLSEKLSSVKPDEDAPDIPLLQDTVKTSGNKSHEVNKVNKLQEEESGGNGKMSSNASEKMSKTRKTEVVKDVNEVQGGSEASVPKEEVKQPMQRSVTIMEVKQPMQRSVTIMDKRKVNIPVCDGNEVITAETFEDVEQDLNWQQILVSGSEDEKALLQEYAKVLKSYKEVKKKLREAEKKERDNEFESIVQIKELKEAIAKKDQEIQALSQKVNLLQRNKNVTEDGALTSDASEDQTIKPKSEDKDLEVKEDVAMEEKGIPNKNEEDKTEIDHKTTDSSAVEEKFQEVDDNTTGSLAVEEKVQQIDDKTTGSSAVEEKVKEIDDKTTGSSAVEEKVKEIDDKTTGSLAVEEKFREVDEKTTGSTAVEEKFREDFDAMLDENLDFWLRFGTSFNRVQKFKNEVHDLKDEISKLQDKKNVEGCITAQLKSEARPHYKHLREIETELTLWLDQNTALKDELKGRFTTLCRIQEEITRALKEGTIDGEVIEFSSHQAAKLQGEIQNMKQENSKVRKELQGGIDKSSLIQVEIEKTLETLSSEFGITSDQPQLQQCLTKAKVPLRSFIFGTRPKKSKPSIFSFMQTQANRKLPVVRAGLPMAMGR